MDFTEEQLERFSRQMMLREIGPAGQEKLAGSRVLIVGAGGLGSPAAMYLAAAGVAHIGVADGDRVELSNLQRQIMHGTVDLGMPKTESARRTLTGINPGTEVREYGFIDGGNIGGIISEYDFVLDCTDSAETKFLINDACVRGGKPFVYAGIRRFGGQLMTVIPHVTPCLRCVFGEPPLKPPDRGVVGAVAGVIGSLQALEAIKYITGAGELLAGRLLVFDGLAMGFRTVSLPPRGDGCPVCSTDAEKTILK